MSGEKGKTPGQIGYEADCAADPAYPGGGTRKAWAQLSEIAQWSWERNPTPRKAYAAPTPSQGDAA